MQDIYVISNLGLVCIVVAWAIQLITTSNKKHYLNPLFVIFYALGSIIIAVDSYNTQNLTIAAFNFATFILSLIAFFRLSNK